MNPSILITPNSVKAGKLYSIIPTDGAGDLNVVRATTATYVGADGLIKTALANEVRFDYTNGSCPSILVEPQRTNLLLRSEEFDNATWTKTASTVTANATTSPSGNLTADKLMEVNGGNVPRLLYIFNATVGQSYTLSFYLKSAERNQVKVTFEGNGAKNAFFNSNTGVVSGIGANTRASMILLNNGWYICSITISAGLLSSSFYIATAENNSLILSGDNTKGIYIWGTQLEVGSYATSYIPTVASAVTRNADVISKTGIADLIGQTEGSFFLDFIFTDNDTSVASIFSISDGTILNRIYIGRLTNRVLRALVSSGGSTVAEIVTSQDMVVGVRYKAAIAYKQNDFVFYVNGVQIGTDTSGTPPSTSQIQNNSGLGSYAMHNPINSVLLFKTRLSNDELATLTTL